MPTLNKQVKQFFPSVEAIPPGIRVSCEPYEMRYLIDGEIRTWTGPAQDIYSPGKIGKIWDGSVVRLAEREK